MCYFFYMVNYFIYTYIIMKNLKRQSQPVIMFRRPYSTFGSLCTPAYLYFIIETIGLILIALQNTAGDSNTLMVGTMSMYVPSVFITLVLKFVYILFWTWILNLICRDGASWVSWVIILFPILLSIIAILLMAKK